MSSLRPRRNGSTTFVQIKGASLYRLRLVRCAGAGGKPCESLPVRNARVATLVSGVPGATTLRQVWENTAERHWNMPAMHTRAVVREVQQEEKFTKEDGTVGTRMDNKVVLEPAYRTLTFGQLHERVVAAGSGLSHLLAELKAQGGGGRVGKKRPVARHVALYAETKAEWMIAALGAFRNNVAVTTAYATLGLDALAYSLDLTDTRIIVTDEALLPQLVNIMGGRTFADGDKSVTADCSHISAIVYVPKTTDSEPDAAAVAALRSRPAEMGGPITVLRFLELESLGRRHAAPEDAFDEEKGTIKTRAAPGASDRFPTSDSTACIMFTSGTTGLPKGVEMTHENILATVEGLLGAVPALTTSDVYIAYLPLAHVLELCAETALLTRGCSVGYSSPGTVTDTARAIPRPDAAAGVPTVKGDATLLRPTLMAGVPTMFERVKGAVVTNVRKQGGLMTRLFNAAVAAKQAARRAGGTAPFPSLIPFYDWLLFDRIRTRALGGRVRLMLSGGGPLARDTEEFISAVFCAPIIQGYGLTETCAAGTINWPDDSVGGRVGPPVLCADIKLVDWTDAGYSHADANPRGEVYIGGKTITKGYYKAPEKTAEVYTTDDAGKRWFATGDIAELQPGGILKIIDRRKDLFKLSHGEYIAPSRIEGALMKSPFIEMAMVHADSHRDYCLVAVVPHRAALAKERPAWAQVSLEALSGNPEVRALMQAEVERVAKAAKLSRVETPQRVFLSPFEWTSDNGLLTETMKVKRHAVVKQFKAQLDALYAAKGEK